MSKCPHCYMTVTWQYSFNSGTRYPVDFTGYLHKCNEYLAALRDRKSRRKMPKHWKYIPDNVVQWNKNKHLRKS